MKKEKVLGENKLNLTVKNLRFEELPEVYLASIIFCGGME